MRENQGVYFPSNTEQLQLTLTNDQELQNK